jgi:hypothetical protein
VERIPLANRNLLENAGYVLDADVGGWVKPADIDTQRIRRVLDADIACRLTPEQIAAWIKAGETGMP